MRNKKIYVITGPTACGKTAVAVALAKRLGGEVVSADSMLVYQGMDIGTAKPTAEEKQGIPHHLMDIITPDRQFSAAEYRQRAIPVTNGIHESNNIPIIAGGTGFYINALIYGNDFSEAPDDTENRCRLMQMDNETLYGQLQVVDPVSAGYIHINNKKRLARALSFYQATGQKLSEHNAEQKKRAPLYDMEFIILYSERNILYERINKRVEEMMQRGLIHEAEKLLNQYPPSAPGMQGIGYKETVGYLNGEYDLFTLKEMVKQSTRHYAKRQLTWFRHQAKNGRWLNTDGKEIEEIINEIISNESTV